MKTNKIKLICFCWVLCLTLSNCNNETIDYKQNQKNESKDTLDADEIIQEIKSDMWNNLKVTYLDKSQNIIDGINNNKDTFFLRIDYQSIKFEELAKTASLEVVAISNNCTISKVDDKYRLIVNSNHLKDTIKYEIHLKSPKYLFKRVDYMNNRNSINEKLRLVTYSEAFSLRNDK